MDGKQRNALLKLKLYEQLLIYITKTIRAPCANLANLDSPRRPTSGVGVCTDVEPLKGYTPHTRKTTSTDSISSPNSTTMTAFIRGGEQRGLQKTIGPNTDTGFCIPNRHMGGTKCSLTEPANSFNSGTSSTTTTTWVAETQSTGK